MKPVQWYSETERLLHQYWRDRIRISGLRRRAQALRHEIGTLERELAEARTIPGLVARYGVVGGRTGWPSDYSDLMVKYDEHTQHIVNRILAKRRELLRLQTRIASLEQKNAVIDELVRRLPMAEQTILEQRYMYRRSNYDIAAMLHCNEKTVRRWRDAAIARVAVWLGKVARNEDCG